MIRMELIRMVKKGKKHVWNKFYLQVCFSIFILMSEMIMYGTEPNGSDKRKKHVFNLICESVFLYHYLDEMITNGRERNKMDRTKGKTCME